jgi:hypothetical protein
MFMETQAGAWNAGQPAHVHSNLRTIKGFIQPRGGSYVRILVAMCLLACFAGASFAQNDNDDDLTAKSRLFPGIGPGLRAVKRGADGRIYVLASPTPGIIVYSEGGKPVVQIGAGLAADPSTKAHPAAIVFGEDCDVDTTGKIYVADRGANVILVFSPDGTLLRSIPVASPISVAALPEGEVAVATLRLPHLVTVFDKNGRDVREFGDPEPIAERQELNRYLNIGQLATDGLGHLYYAFAYTPEATVRQYDRYGYAGEDIQYTSVDALTAALAVRREIARQERRGDQPSFKRNLTAVGVDRTSGEVWIALHNLLLQFDKDGSRRASYLLYTPQGARLEASTILIEKDRLIIGSDPLGVYEFTRPVKKVLE